jgi:hypothetical protein
MAAPKRRPPRFALVGAGAQPRLDSARPAPWKATRSVTHQRTPFAHLRGEDVRRSARRSRPVRPPVGRISASPAGAASLRARDHTPVPSEPILQRSAGSRQRSLSSRPSTHPGGVHNRRSQSAETRSAFRSLGRSCGRAVAGDIAQLDSRAPWAPLGRAAGSSTNTSTAKSGSMWCWLMNAITVRSSWRSTIATSSSRMTCW